MPAPKSPQMVPLVSVIVPIYQVEPWLTDCLESVIAQDYPSVEIVLVDDASTDGSNQIATAFAQRDARIRLIRHETNRGSGPARNTGILHAAGTWLLLLDSDDLLASPHAVTRLVTVARESGCRVVIGSCDQLQEDGHVVDFDRKFDLELGGKPGTVLAGEDAYLAAWGRPQGSWLPIRGSGLLIERDILTRLNLWFPSGEHEDMCFTPLLYYKCGGVFYDGHIALRYRKRSSSISNTPWTPARMQRYVGVWKQMHSHLERFGLRGQIANTAVKFLESMVGKIEANGGETVHIKDVLQAIEGLLTNVGEPTDLGLFNYVMDRMALVFGSIFRSRKTFRVLVTLLPQHALLRYYCLRLSQADLPAMFEGNARMVADQPCLPLQSQDVERTWHADMLYVCHCLIASGLAVVSEARVQADWADREAALQANIAAANERAHQANLRYEAIISSNSWRVMAPFRYVMGLFPGRKGTTSPHLRP